MQCSFIRAHAVTKQLNAYIHMSPMVYDQRRCDTEKQQQQLIQQQQQQQKIVPQSTHT